MSIDTLGRILYPRRNYIVLGIVEILFLRVLLRCAVVVGRGTGIFCPIQGICFVLCLVSIRRPGPCD